MSVLLVMQVISHKTDVTNYMCNLPLCISFLLALRVEFLLKTDIGYPKDTGVNKPWQPLRIPSAITFDYDY